MIKLSIPVVLFLLIFRIDALQKIPDLITLKDQLDKHCSGLDTNIDTYGTIDKWDVSEVTDMTDLFEQKPNCNPNISAWNVGAVTSFQRMFKNALKFNQDLSGWNLSSATNLKQMFAYAKEFDQDISAWNVSSGREFSWMFEGAIKFNRDISGWNVSSGLNFAGMFYNAQEFNQDISGWDVSSGTDFAQMFYAAIKFNQDISGWDVSSGTNFEFMFSYAISFRQDLVSSWPQVAIDANGFCTGAVCNFVAPPTTYIPTKTPIFNPTETPISKDPTSEPTIISLEDLWKIVPGSNTYENSKFSFNYEIHRHHLESNLRAVVLDKECTNPTNLNHAEVPSAFITKVQLISAENALVEITLNTSQIVDLGSNYFEYRENGDASVYFCLRFGLFDGGEEVNFVDSVAQLDVSLTDRNFTVTGLNVSPKDNDVLNETDVFTVTVEFCDSAGNLLSNVVLNQGQSIKVCVSVDDQTTIIDELFDFSWKKDDDGEYSQVALDNDGNAEKFSSLSCNGLSAECSFETLLTAQFYTSTSTVTGRGSALLKFYTGRRAMSRILLSRSVQDSGSETAGVATMYTPQLTTASYEYKGTFISSGLSHSPFKVIMVFTFTSSLLLIL